MNRLPNSPTTDPPWQVAVIGAGAAGLLAACRAAERGKRTVLLEKNKRAGVKILMSGGTRCNLTQATDRQGIVQAFGTQGRFLHSALASLGPEELVALVEAEGVPTKVEPTGKIFPVSNRARDVLDALLRRLLRSGATLLLGESLVQLEPSQGGFRLTTAQRTLVAEKVIVTTGGQSYPGCGTTGDGYRWAERFGHTIISPHPALVPLKVNAPWVPPLQGITLPDVAVAVLEPGTTPAQRPAILAQQRGSLLLTHFGLSGPVILDISRVVSGHRRPETLVLECDCLPQMPEPQFEESLKQASSRAGTKALLRILSAHFPQRFGETLLQRAQLPLERTAATLSKPERNRLVQHVKHLRIGASGTLGFGKAEVTAGGVCLDEVDSHTMQSKRIPHLYFAGEVLDVDGPIGGYNFQAAFSTGWLAGECV